MSRDTVHVNSRTPSKYAQVSVNELPPQLNYLIGYDRKVNPPPASLEEALTNKDPDSFRRVIAAAKRDQFKGAELRGLAPLWKYGNEFIDDAVNRVGRKGLVIADDRINQFAVNLPNWISIMVLTSHKLSGARRAQRGIVPGSRGEGGMQDKTPYSVPIYVTWDEFAFNARELAEAERTGRPLDTDEAEQSVRNVNYAIEDAQINGLDVNIAGLSTPGFLDTTTTRAYAGGAAWTAKTGAEILTEVLAMQALLTPADTADGYFPGPYTLYVPTLYGATMQRPFDASGGTSVTIQRFLEQLQFGGRELRVRQADLLPANRTLLVQDEAQVADIIVGAQVSTINPSPEYEWHTRWTTFAVIIPRVKTDYNSKYGVVAGDLT